MAKQVIVVVHGVGVKQAGVSSDLLAAALQDGDGSDKTRLPPHSSDDFVLLEPPLYDTSGKASTFPARVRRYRCYDGDGKIENERVIADFFWGDVTAFGSGVVDVVLAYFRVAMGLSHAIRENASEVYPGANFEDRWIRRLARGAALTIHGPVIALNIVMLLGLLLAALLQSFVPDASPTGGLVRWQIGVVGLSAIIAGLFLLKRGGSFLYRHLLSWVVLSGVAFLLVGSPELFGLADHEAIQPVKSWLVSLGTGMTLDKFRSTYPDVLGSIIGVGWRFLTLMFFAWIVVFIQVFLVCILGLVRLRRVGAPQVPNLVIPAIGLMSLLWFFLCAALWAAVLKLPAYLNLGLKSQIVASALIAIGAAVAVLVLLAAAALLVFLRKKELTREPFAIPTEYMTGADSYANRYRLLIASKMLVALNIFLPLVLATFCLVSLAPIWPGSAVASTSDAVKNVLENWTVTIIFAILAIGSLLVYSFRAEFSAGLGILADVLAYLNNSSWLSGDAGDPYKTGEPQRQTWLERTLFKNEDHPATNASPRGYWLRRRIHDRLDVLIRTLIRDEKPDRLDIVSHSQGTMIAIDLVDFRGREWLKELPPGSPGDIRLVTMGSPQTHLYSYYFPSSFQPVEKRPNLQKGGLLRDWLNIFRIDDFVGTHIGKGDWPREFPVSPNGHTNYWVDRGVVKRLREFLKVGKP